MEKSPPSLLSSFIRHLVIATMLFVLSLASSAQTIDPFDPNSVAMSAPPSVKVVYEVFSLPLGQAAALQRAGLTDAKCYQRLLSGLEDDSVTLETFLTVRGTAGRSMTTSEGQDYRYPTEFDPPELPNQVTGPANRKTKNGLEITVFPATSANPTSYTTRFLGQALTAEADVDDGGRITLFIQPTRTILLQKDVYGRGLAQTEYPRFATPAINTEIITTSGKPFLLGTVSPPAEQQPKQGEGLTHFAFVTATHLDPKK